MLITLSSSSTTTEQFLSIDPINALITFLSLIIAIIALIYAKRADKIANEIANKQRIDSLMPDIVISDINAKTILRTTHFPLLQINSVKIQQDNSSSFILNNSSVIQHDELIQTIKVEIELKNSSSNSAIVLIRLLQFEEKKIDITGLDTVKLVFEKEDNISDISTIQEILRGEYPCSFMLSYNGLGTESYDEINGIFQIPYQENQLVSDCIKISKYESKKNRIYRT